MNREISITGTGETPDRLDSAERIAHLLETAISDSAWINHCDGVVCVSCFSSHSKSVEITGTFSGIVNREEVSVPFERDYVFDEDAPWMNPVVVIFSFPLYVFRACNKRLGTAEHWIARSELEIASSLEAKLNKTVGAPVEGVRLVWRNSLIAGGAMFLLSAAPVTVNCFVQRFPRNGNDNVWGELLVALYAGVLAGFPTGMAGICLRLAFVGREVEDSVAGQALLRMVGAKNAKSLRTISIIGAILCLLVTAAFVRGLV